MAQVQVITGIERRRRWSEAEKRALVAAAFAPGAVVTAVARQADINTGLIYRWRRELSDERRGFAEVVVTPVNTTPDVPATVIEVLVGGNAHVRISALASPTLAAAVVRALAGR